MAGNTQINCLDHLLEGPGGSISMNPHGMDSGTLQFKCSRTKSCDFATDAAIGPGMPHPEYRWLFVSSVVHTNDGAFDIVNVTYEGCQFDKYPTGGAQVNLIENGIATHVNYKDRPGTWIPTLVPFGAGNSPNSYGRILHDGDGTFKAFGPMPDNMDGRPNGRINDTEAQKLEGIEAFLEPGQMIYRYSRLTKTSGADDCGAHDTLVQHGRLLDKWIQHLAKITWFSSAAIPVPTLPHPDADWLMTSVNEDVKVQNGGNVKYFNTTFEFTGSGPGGWAKYVYQPATSSIIFD